MVRTIIIGAVCLALAGCVRANTTMLDSRTAIISGKGSAFDTQAEVLQKVLAEAATTAKAKGYEYFVIVDAANTTTEDTMFIPGQTYTSGYAFGTGSVYGDSINMNTSYSGYSWSTPSTVSTVVKPGADVMIRMYKAGEINASQSGVWSADDILRASAN